MKSLLAISLRSLRQLAVRPLFWYSMIALPLALMFFLTTEMDQGIPQGAPVGLLDKDHTSLSRRVTRTLASMQLLSVGQEANSYTEAMRDVRAGRTFGFFLIPENYEADMLAGRSPVVSFYANMTYFVPGTLTYKNFLTIASYTKAGVLSELLKQSTGATEGQIAPILAPITIQAHGINNPYMNYAYYLGNSFIPAVFQLMIMLLTCYTVCEEIKRGTSVRLMQMAGGSVLKALTGKLLPQTLIWVVMVFFMEVWLFKFEAYPMHGSWLWMTVNGALLVVASQGLALFICGLLPSLRLSLSIAALVGILTFSLAAFSFPEESMYPAVQVFSWILPVRYYFLIYINEALDGVPLYYSRVWFAAYFAFLAAPLLLLPRLKKALLHPVYVP